MKISGYVTRDTFDGTPAEVKVNFLDDVQKEILHSMTVVVENPEGYFDTSSLLKSGAYRKALEKIIPQLQAVLKEAVKTT